MIFLVSCQTIPNATTTQELPREQPLNDLTTLYPEPMQGELGVGIVEEIYPSRYLPQEIDLQYPAPTPRASENDLSTLTGQLFLKNQIALSRTLVYITPGRGETQSPPIILFGPDLEKGDFATLTDDNAYFSINNINPGIYFLIVSSTNNWTYVENDGQPLKLILKPNEILDLGNVYVEF